MPNYEAATTRPAEFLGAEPPESRKWLYDNGDGQWIVNDSSFADYSRRANILGHPEGLSGIVHAQVGIDTRNVGMDIAAGSSARALRDLLDSGILGKALATNFEDRRPKEVKRDPRLNHVAGDITKLDTWDKILGWTSTNAPDGLAVAMHRPIGGLQELPLSTYRGAAHFILDMLRPGGLMFTQVPRDLVEDQRSLATVCTEIRGRSDVAEVIVSPPREPGGYVDESDLYAVILRK